MKHLLILLSILLLSSPVVCQSLNGFFETKMREMLSFISINCGKIEGIHPEHDPCSYNYKIRLPAIKSLSEENMTKDGRATFQVDGLYFPDEETIYLKKSGTKISLRI